MPLIIKSVGGVRSCQKISSSTNVADDIVAALKGMTLTLEVKVLDVDRPKSHVPPKPRVDFPSSDLPVQTPIEIPLEEPYMDTAETPMDKPKELPLEKAKEAPVQKTKEAPTEEPKSVKPVIEPKPSAMTSHERGMNILRQSTLPEPKQQQKPNVVPGTLSDLVGDGQISSSPSPDVNPLAQVGLDRPSIEVGIIIPKAFFLTGDDNPESSKNMKDKVAYISRDNSLVMKMLDELGHLADEIERSPTPRSVEIGQVVVAQSADDDQWYRAVVEDKSGSKIDVFYFDWAIREKLRLERIRTMSHPNLSLTKYPANSIKMKFIDTHEELIEKATSSESPCKLELKSFDSRDYCYLAKILDE